eukprot:4231936-Pyramimonas_sp.AAC.1
MELNPRRCCVVVVGDFNYGEHVEVEGPLAPGGGRRAAIHPRGRAWTQALAAATDRRISMGKCMVNHMSYTSVAFRTMRCSRSPGRLARRVSGPPRASSTPFPPSSPRARSLSR